MSFFYCTGFTFNGQHSDSFGVKLTSSNSSTVPFSVGGYEVLEDKILRVDKTLFLGTDKKILEFDIEIHKLSADVLSETELRNLSTWLFQKTYKPLISDQYPNVIYNVIFNGLEKIIVGNAPRGLKLHVKCDSPYPYLAQQTQNITVGESTTTFTIDTTASNFKDYYKNIEFQFALGGATTSISLKNATTNKTMSFTSLTPSETLYINNGRKEITSSTSNNRFPNFNFVWLDLKPSTVNTFEATGQSDLTVKYSLPILQ